MAWGSPVEDVEFSSAVSATTYTFSPLATIPAGTFIFLFVAGNAASTVSSVADNSTQAGTANTYVIGTQCSGSTLAGTPCYCLKTTRAILSSDVITATQGASASRRNGVLLTWAIPAGDPVLDAQSGAAAVTASPLSFASSGALTGTGELAIACGAYKSSAASGFADPTSGFTATSVTGSGGTVTFVEADVSYNLNAGTTAVAPTHTYTLAPTSAVGRLLVFGGGTLVVSTPARMVTRRS